MCLAERPHRSAVSHGVYSVLSSVGVPDHKVSHSPWYHAPLTRPAPQGGVVLLLCGMCLMVVQKKIGRKLAVDLGGPKRLQAVSSLVVAVLLLPWALYQLLTQTVSP